MHRTLYKKTQEPDMHVSKSKTKMKKKKKKTQTHMA